MTDISLLTHLLLLLLLLFIIKKGLFSKYHIQGKLWFGQTWSPNHTLYVCKCNRFLFLNQQYLSSPHIYIWMWWKIHWNRKDDIVCVLLQSSRNRLAWPWSWSRREKGRGRRLKGWRETGGLPRRPKQSLPDRLQISRRPRNNWYTHTTGFPSWFISAPSWYYFIYIDFLYCTMHNNL